MPRFPTLPKRETVPGQTPIGKVQGPVVPKEVQVYGGPVFLDPLTMLSYLLEAQNDAARTGRKSLWQQIFG